MLTGVASHMGKLKELQFTSAANRTLSQAYRSRGHRVLEKPLVSSLELEGVTGHPCGVGNLPRNGRTVHGETTSYRSTIWALGVLSRHIL